MNFFKKFFSKEKEEDLHKGLEKTKESFFSQITKAVAGKSKVDISFLDELEQILISSDVGLETTVKIIDRLEAKVAEEKYLNSSELNDILKSVITDILSENNTVDLDDFVPVTSDKPHVIMVVGVNGVGKTTTIGKLANQYTKRGYKVVLGAGDTFRAAAVDQLEIWAGRSRSEFYSKGMNTDPAAVAYETVQYAQNHGCDVAIIDTAGRLHTKRHLMDELTKIKKSMDKKMNGAPHEVLLVLDATTGQNAIEQARHFTDATDVTALALTKLDGSAKGGVVLGISDQFKIPVKYIGVGEGVEQLQVFNRKVFVDMFFGHKLDRE
ncbi:MAG: signal recognition particle-docking protein FtsY [Saprospiraceae bacterium]|jgi:fused signal recognition particle receptor|nr:signal recognition particle-docking protein FtsY [Saprospiraceae bacterium]MBK6565433.1 signal recognition particle-docking protein FtsY [Saprospiraceae bacterium]MBK8079984.1 signal recognition particle-docking protein FtsY [Saprospiraceae bacterium]MBK8370880.1 signal recognition particle-docking protein FtsY [Saprospiraceae bacterium]MBK8546183.1 signal recognition particle-docking protein FtsY [Saprospiraceae bacterium]